MTKKQLKTLKPYCQTKIQLERLEAVIQHGKQTIAAEKLGCDKRRISETISQIKSHARKQGYEVGGKPFQPILGHFVKGESALVDSDGITRMKWVKTDTNKELQLEQLRTEIVNVFSEYQGKSVDAGLPQEQTRDDLLCVIPLGDAHISMLAWAPETGEDFDLYIAEQDLCTAFERLIEAAPYASTCIIADMGDYFHRNNNKNTTPESGNVLDCDSRFQKMIRVGVKIMIHAVNEAMKKFDKVIVRNVLGNHAPEAEQMLQVALELYYHNNDRVYVDISPNKFWYYPFGNTLLGLCHGDKVKQDQLPMIMAADVPELWGKSLFRYWLTGHWHSQVVKEYQGCSVEVFNNLAPNDAWHHASGYRSRCNLKLLTYHKNYGEIERITKDISMIRDSMDGAS